MPNHNKKVRRSPVPGTESARHDVAIDGKLEIDAIASTLARVQGGAGYALLSRQALGARSGKAHCSVSKAEFARNAALRPVPR